MILFSSQFYGCLKLNEKFFKQLKLHEYIDTAIHVCMCGSVNLYN